MPILGQQRDRRSKKLENLIQNPTSFFEGSQSNRCLTLLKSQWFRFLIAAAVADVDLS